MADSATEGNGGWMGDVQRAIALVLVVTFALIVLLGTIRLVWLGDSAAINDMVKTLQAALVNMALIALGFFFGSNLSKMQADASQQKMVEKLTTPAIAPAPAPAPVAAVTAWWSLLTETERAAIAGDPDTRVQLFSAAAKVGRATPDDLTYVVGKGLLTQERATQISAV